MPDREKVIKGIEYCIHTDGVECPNCPYWPDNDCVETLHSDTLELLKEQEAVKPTWRQRKAYCGSCGKRIPLKIGARFCHKCGKAVKWEYESRVHYQN